MNIKKELIGLGIWVSVGAVVGLGIGLVSYHYSQPRRVLSFQKIMLEEYTDPNHKDEVRARGMDLITHAKDVKLCGRTVINEMNDVLEAATKEVNSCSASYTTTSTPSSEVQVPDIIAVYTNTLLEACK